ncbi:sigma-54 interaction domain-containing protein [Desulfitobacterium sp. AusDCA]|uniref:sigma-54 interaction domain-containing protein n=1 Tax=Desulfitobacterium sp. AusDCA TaxID=3240383 RepID=UPI003DA6DDE2
MAKKEVMDIKNNNSQTLEELMDYSYDSVFVTNSEGIVVMANSASERLLNIPLSEMIGSNVSTLINKEYYNRSTALEATEAKRTITGVIRTWDGRSLVTTSRPLFDAEGNVTIVISNCRDEDSLIKFAENLDREREVARRYKEEVKYLRNQGFENKCIVAESPALKNILLKADAVAPTDSSVLLYGESGTGKEVLAKYLHTNSLRAKEAFITVNCGAIPESLIESELFGYEKGSFTGADAKGKAGLFEIADKGTIFLDEIGEMPLAVQVKLLRVLESGDVRRLGGTVSHKVDVRVICATNRNLKNMVGNKLFREDLYYRINVVPLRLPPLRERPEDIIALSDMFLKIYNKKYGYNKVFSRNILNGFLTYNWPGNVRELRNLIERLVITTVGNTIDYYENVISIPLDNVITMPLDNDGEKDSNIFNISVPFKGILKDMVGLFEKQYIENVLQTCNGCVSKAAEILGIDRSAVYRKVHIVDLRNRSKKEQA